MATAVLPEAVAPVITITAGRSITKHYEPGANPARKADMSGKRGSNSRPSAWEADALPTELLPHAAAKVHILRVLANNPAEKNHFAGR